tara:strand:+ start:2797 stop:3654 length:858 start_codon:yes stop_codon:yes gene_type:complete
VFELNGDARVVAFKDIKGRAAIIVDDFYRDPDEVRELALSLRHKDRSESSLVGGFPGGRSFLDTLEVKEKLYNIFLDLCSNKLWKIPDKKTGFEEDVENWPSGGISLNSDGSFNIPLIKKNRSFNLDDFNSNWDRQRFMVNVTNDDLLIKDPLHIIPHQDYWEDEPESTFQFGCVVYLNTPDECPGGGGTNLYSYKGEMYVPNRMKMFDATMNSWMEECLKLETNIEKFKYLKSKIDSGELYECEFEAEMKYNRMVLYPADVLHMADVDLGMFTDYNRINQIMFM